MLFRSQANIQGLEHSFAETLPVVVIDEDGAPMTGSLTVTPPSIRLTIPVKTGFPSKQLPVKVPTNVPPEGIRVAAFAWPETVVVEGPARVLENLVYLPTEEIDVSHLRHSATLTRSLVLPYESLRVVGSTSVRVSMQVNEVPIEMRIASLALRLVGRAAQGLIVVPETADLILRGRPSDLARVATAGLALELDAPARLPASGSHLLRLPLELPFRLPFGVELVGFWPATVSVLLSDPASPASAP